MTEPRPTPNFLDFDVDALPAHGEAYTEIYAGRLTGAVVRRALPPELVATAAAALAATGSPHCLSAAGPGHSQERLPAARSV